jgi:hypothetical protein
MSLENWLRNGFLRKHDPTLAEVQQLLGVVDRELSDASAQGLSPDGKFEHAYNAARLLCMIALHASGYEVGKGSGHHHYIINSLEHTLGASQADNTVYLSRCSKQRSQGLYDRAGVVDQKDADDLLATAAQLKADVLAWLRANHSQILPKGR